MQALSHSLTHRGSGAGSRARSRWQPYASSITPTKSPASYLNTPSSSVSSSPRQLCRHSHVSQDSQRQVVKSRYVAFLIDQTVNSLCEIWQCQQTPSLPFINAAHIANAIYQECPRRSTDVIINHRNTQLPSPISPSTHPTPPQSPFSTTTQTPLSSYSSTSPNLIPLKSFVQEVLRRSRTSGSVLQTALCYLEAVRRKVPQIACGTIVEEDSRTRLPSSDNECLSLPQIPPPERPLISPLSCPRRTFLASLILASKFLQDRCYSNRAWAKLSGLSAREIGRCEKALGDALEWRLWVGKSGSKPLVRSKTEHDIAALGALKGARRTFARAKTVPYLGTDSMPSSCASADFVYSQPQLDPYQEWLALNQSRILEEEEESQLVMPSTNVDHTSTQQRDDTPILPTPALVSSPTSTICSSSSLSLSDTDEGERTIQVADISEPILNKSSVGCGWYDSDELKHGIDVEIFNPTPLALTRPPNQMWY